MRSSKLGKWLLTVRECAVAVGLMTSFPATGSASVDICQQPATDPYFSIAYHHHNTFSDARSNGEIDRESSSIDMHVNLSETWSMGVGHRYDQLDAAGIGLPTNGHLHTVFMPFHRQIGSDTSGFRVSVAPAMAASSNVLKDPDEYSADAFQLLAALVWNRNLSEKTAVRFGACGDHRFGGYSVYPLVSFDWQPHNDWLIELGFPVSRMTWQVTDSLAMALRVAPDGNEWHVENKAMDRQSQLVYEATLFEYAVNWQFHERLTASVSAGRLVDIRYKVTLLNDINARLTGSDVTRVGAAIRWRF